MMGSLTIFPMLSSPDLMDFVRGPGADREVSFVFEEGEKRRGEPTCNNLKNQRGLWECRVPGCHWDGRAKTSGGARFHAKTKHPELEAYVLTRNPEDSTIPYQGEEKKRKATELSRERMRRWRKNLQARTKGEGELEMTRRI